MTVKVEGSGILMVLQLLQVRTNESQSHQPIEANPHLYSDLMRGTVNIGWKQLKCWTRRGLGDGWLLVPTAIIDVVRTWDGNASIKRNKRGK